MVDVPEDAEQTVLLEELRAHAKFPERFALFIEPGWIPLVRECHRRLVDEFPEYEVAVISQKYGELRFYARPRPMTDATSEDVEEQRRVNEIIGATRSRCSSTCELCGEPGSGRHERMYEMTLCDSCEATTADPPPFRPPAHGRLEGH